MSIVARRMWRAVRLESDLYEEVEADRSATGQSAVVVLLSALGAGAGSVANGGLEGIVLCTAAALASWYVWAVMAAFIGTRWLPEPETSSDTGELLRTLGYSTAPGVFRVFAIIEPIAGWVFLICSVWMLAAMVVAVRQALDYRSTLRAIAVCTIGFPIYAISILVSLLWAGPWPI